MPQIFDWSATRRERLTTVGGLRAARGRHGSFAQVTADTAVEAAAAETAGVEMVVCRAQNVKEVRQGSSKVFVTAALGFAQAVTNDEILRTALTALVDGADAVITARRLEVVSLLAAEDVPVMGHLGYVPRKSTWVGGIRAFGKTADEAVELFHRFRRLEEAGAFAVEVELVPAGLMAEISSRTGLVTVSLGSGPAADVMFLFTSDICGESERLPRHARRYADIASLQKRIVDERIAGLSAFRRDIRERSFPSNDETARVDDAVLDEFRARIGE